MKVNKKEKIVRFEPKDDNEWKIALIHPDFQEYIILKVTYTDKGFGVQAFSQMYYDDVKSRRPLNIVVGERGEQVLHKETYAAIWKLTPKFTRKLREKFK